MILGWAAGTAFFYGSCYWLTYSMIHHGGLPSIVAFLLLLPATIVVGIFPSLFALLFAVSFRKWGHWALLLAPVFWTALEWFRLIVTGQLWNAEEFREMVVAFRNGVPVRLKDVATVVDSVEAADTAEIV